MIEWEIFPTHIVTLFFSRIDQEMHGKGEMRGAEWRIWRGNERWRKLLGFLCLSRLKKEKKKEKISAFQNSIAYSWWDFLFFIVLVCQTRVEISVLCFKYFYNLTCICSEVVVILVSSSCCFSLRFKTLGFQLRWCMFCYVTLKIYLYTNGDKG